MSEISVLDKKHTVDGINGDSSLSIAEQAHQPRPETLEDITGHPAERFPWLQEDEFFRKKAHYQVIMSTEIAGVLAIDPKFKYRDDPEITRAVAEVYAGAKFVAACLQEAQPDKSVPAHIIDIAFMRNSAMGGKTTPIFQLHDSKVADFTQVAPEDIGDLRLKEVLIGLNINNLGDDVKYIQECANELKQQGEPKEDVDEWQAYMRFRRRAILEADMVEEMAHAFDYMEAASNPENLRKLVETTKRYPHHISIDTYRDFTPEEAKARIADPMEMNAAKWVDAFMQQYYPDMKNDVKKE